jgi:hypothetical protein
MSQNLDMKRYRTQNKLTRICHLNMSGIDDLAKCPKKAHGGIGSNLLEMKCLTTMLSNLLIKKLQSPAQQVQ